MIRKSIPNLITCLNLTCGFLAILSNDLQFGVLLVILGGLFDVFDGLAARALNVSSAIGKELDSLADVVSFGVAPAVLFYRAFAIEGMHLFLLGAIALVLGGALRLARFNTSDDTSSYFEGLAIPASGLMICGLVYAQEVVQIKLAIFLIIAISLAFLNLSKIKMFSFKQFGQTIVKVYFGIILLIGILVFLFLPSLTLSSIIASYIILACIEHLRITQK